MSVDVIIRELIRVSLYLAPDRRESVGAQADWRAADLPAFPQSYLPLRVVATHARGKLLDQAVANRVGGKIGIGLHIHFFKHPRTVGAHCFDA